MSARPPAPSRPATSNRERSLLEFDARMHWPTLVVAAAPAADGCGIDALVVGTETLLRHSLLGHFFELAPDEVLAAARLPGPFSRFARAANARPPSVRLLTSFVHRLADIDVALALLVAADRQRLEQAGRHRPLPRETREPIEG